MAATFEVVVAGADEAYARQAAAAAFAEIDRLEEVLSRFVDSSDISRINTLQAGQSTKIGFDTLECLEVAANVHAETAGAFDVTIGPLFECWRTKYGEARTPSKDELATARARVGMQWLELDRESLTVRVLRDDVHVDLGGIGKGFALDKAAQVLAEWSVESVLVHGGESTVLGIGAPPGQDGWPVTVGGSGFRSGPGFTVRLNDGAVSGSGIELKGRHIFNPHTGKPVADKLAAWALVPTGVVADALSTAFVVMSPRNIKKYCRKHADTSAMILVDGEPEPTLQRIGRWPGQA